MKKKVKQQRGTKREPIDNVKATNRGMTAVTGKVRPLLPEGRRVMTCVDHELRSTRFGDRHYLRWKDRETGQILEQYFPHEKGVFRGRVKL